MLTSDCFIAKTRAQSKQMAVFSDAALSAQRGQENRLRLPFSSQGETQGRP